MPFDYNTYYKEYTKNSFRVNISFNKKNPTDVKALEILNSKNNKSGFIKELILRSVQNEDK